MRRMQPSFRWQKLLPILAVAALTTCVHADDSRVTLMSYNVWKSWSQVDDGFRKGIESIKASGADIIGIQEASPELADRIAGELGWFRAERSNGSTQIVSRFPIVESMAIDRLGGARIRISQKPGREIIVFNCHLDYRVYGPYAAMKSGATVTTVLQQENQSERAAQMKGMLEFMKNRLDAADTLPVFLTGDFNGPSHLDWTAATAHLHGNVGAVEWSPSVQVIGAGMIDSFRAIHPDPVGEPGFTWSSIHKASEPQDRIDFTYHKGKGVTVRNSRVFTTNVEATVGPWDASDLAVIRKNTWPSDHAAVVTEYLLE
jgi:endonuclease/exonuclease/phosphatase family metal-dependent hydrolase